MNENPMLSAQEVAEKMNADLVVLGRSVVDFLRLANVNPATWYRIKAGKHVPSWDVMRRLQTAMNALKS